MKLGEGPTVGDPRRERISRITVLINPGRREAESLAGPCRARRWRVAMSMALTFGPLRSPGDPGTPSRRLPILGQGFHQPTRCDADLHQKVCLRCLTVELLTQTRRPEGFTVTAALLWLAARSSPSCPCLASWWNRWEKGEALLPFTSGRFCRGLQGHTPPGSITRQPLGPP